MRRDRDDSRYLSAASGEARDEVRQITGKASAVVILHEAAHAIEVGMRDKQARRSPYRFMRPEKTAIVVDSRARPKAANQAEASRFLAGRPLAFGAQDAFISC